MTTRYRTKQQVNLRAFADLETRRVEMSNTIWAMLVGSKLAADSLASLAPPQPPLSVSFPHVPHVNRMNLRPADARVLLDRSEGDLGVMGVSYAIAMHEDFVKTCLSWLLPLGKISNTKLNNATTANVHELLGSSSGRQVRAASLKLFHLTRFMRNCHIHSGGVASATLESFMREMSPLQKEEWSRLTGAPFAVVTTGSYVHIGIPELVATLAVGKRLSYEVNLCLQRAIPKKMWADFATRDYFSISGSKPPKDPAARKTLLRYVARNFGAVKLSTATVEAALGRYQGK